MKRRSGCRTATALAFLSACLAADSPPPQNAAPSGAVTITADFPGGNVQVDGNEGGDVRLSPDLRGDRPWFYWCFEAKAVRPGRVRFVFPEKVIGFQNGAIGFQGPAVSTDSGRTWDWMGTGTVDANAFTYDFAKPGQTVRFAVTLPYVASDLAVFLDKHSGNPHLTTSVLTKSRGGRDVELLRIGTPGPGKRPLLLTARHHAAETIADYVLEGMLAEALAETPDGRAFRERFVLYAVPFVDKDGVEEGDQGKNRKPHDHNRDYGDASLYPETRAIKALQAEVGFRYALDLHCPTLVKEDHQVLYFVGEKTHPSGNFTNVSAFAERIKNGLPANAPHGPLVWLKDETAPAAMCTRFFAHQEGVVMAATLEIPFAPPGKAADPASCRRYGRTILQAFVGTRFDPDRPE